MKRLCCAALAALLLLASACAQSYAVGGSALVTAEGDLLIPAGEYASIRPVGGGFFAAREVEADGWQILDETGAVVAPGSFEDLSWADGFLLFRTAGLWGAMDESLSVVYPAEYTRLVSNGEGGFLALRTDPDDETGDGVYYLDGSGAEETTGTVTVYGLGEFSCGLCAAAGTGRRRYGYLDATGVWAISPQYGYAMRFNANGVAAASVDSGAGLIDTEGNWVLSPRYETVACVPGNRLAAASSGAGHVLLYDTAERTVVADIEGETSAYARTERLRDRAMVTVDGVVRLYAADGSVVASWDEEEGVFVRSLGGDLLAARTDAGEWLLSEMAEVLAGPYASIRPVDTGLYACVPAEGGCLLVDATGTAVLKLDYSAIRRGAPGLYVAWDGETPVLIDREGTVLTLLDPDSADG